MIKPVFVTAALSVLALVAAKPQEVSWLNNAGVLTPYQKGTTPAGVKDKLPEDCTVTQVMLMNRHGSRYPQHELELIHGMQAKVAQAAEYIAKAKLPKEFQFLKKGYVSTLGTASITANGRKELFSHGVNFLLRYPHLKAQTILSGSVPRVVESAQWFAQGYFGTSWNNVSSSVFSILNTDNVTIQWIAPYSTCPKWSFDMIEAQSAPWEAKFIPPITKRFNALIPGLNFSDTDTLGALNACPYDYAAHSQSPWCGVFTEKEILDNEYDHDLFMHGGWGYNAQDNMGPMQGTLYINKLIERFSNSTGNAQEMYLEFGHDTTIVAPLTTLGIAKDTPPLTGEARREKRKWITSRMTPFAAQMVFEKFTCSSSFQGPQIRLVLNEATMPLELCAKTSEDKKYGTCSFENFVKANSYATSIKWGDAAWNATCGVANL
ncbi:hypothetical protein HGRIS_002029 [Hohenbuehelia grisea]|uniref:Phosphoglycerate mutase-like protein n=1 Tax=Hohenbuehelia grisea TaxID=104357 RepID=A0ABR3JL08_9AGAR